MAWCMALFLIGFTLRVGLVLLTHRPHSFPASETVNIALSLAHTGRYADAYGPGLGPTAHCVPFFPLWLSVLIRIFGTGTTAALAMEIASSFASALAFALLPLLADACGLPLLCGVAAGLAGALLPFDFIFEVLGVFDAPYTGAVLVALSILVCRIWMRNGFSKRAGAGLGIAAGLASLLNPVMLPLLGGWLIVLLVEQRRQLRRMLIFCAVCAVCVMATLTPWAVRNYEVLGSLIWTRSNFWLEMRVSNNDLLTADQERNIFLPGYAIYHPSDSPVERAKVKQMGEVAYMSSLRPKTLNWIATHKRRFLQLTAERFRIFWVPTMKRPFQTIGEAALSILGLIGLALLFQARLPAAWLFGVIVVLYPPVYYLVQDTPRYRLPLEPFLYLLAAYCLLRIAVVIAGRRRDTLAANTVSVRP